MARYILLRVNDDAEADELLLDLAMHPERPIRTGYVGASVHVELTNDIDTGDTSHLATLPSFREDESLQELIRDSYRRAYDLCTQYENTGDTSHRGH